MAVYETSVEVFECIFPEHLLPKVEDIITAHQDSISNVSLYAADDWDGIFEMEITCTPDSFDDIDDALDDLFESSFGDGYRFLEALSYLDSPMDDLLGSFGVKQTGAMRWKSW